MHATFKTFLLALTNASDCSAVTHIQTLWSGYGTIRRYHLENSDFETVVVKEIQRESSQKHPRGWHTDFGHQRKLRSYEVETHWYRSWSASCDEHCKVPQLMGILENEAGQWIVMEDLNASYPLLKTTVGIPEVKTCLKWLAHFHAKFLYSSPQGLWEVGTYWHLETRPDEYATMANGALKSKAELIDQRLNTCQYQTLVHGDAKLANFCFSHDGTHVAAVDFQYVGGGCGIKDVAYFLGSCLSSSECEMYQDVLLNAYFECLDRALQLYQNSVDFKVLESEWRSMYPIACADFARFLLGWMPNHQKLNAYMMRQVAAVLNAL